METEPSQSTGHSAKNEMTHVASGSAALQRIGDLHLSRGRIEQALQRYRTAVELSQGGPDEAESHAALGDAYVYADQNISALRQYRRAIKHSPRRAAPHFSLAELYRRYGKVHAALLEYRAAVECDPQNAFYHYKLGDTLADAGYVPEAIGELEAATELAASDGFYHFWLSDLYLMAGKLDEAIREMQQAAMFAPYDDYYNMRLAVLYLLSGHPTDAATALTQSIKISPRNAIYHCLLADIYCHSLGDNSLAMRHYRYAGNIDDYDREHVRRIRQLTGLEISIIPEPVRLTETPLLDTQVTDQSNEPRSGEPWQ